MSGIPNHVKGEFRPIYSSLPDHPKWQALSRDARLLLLVLKTKLPAVGIGVLYEAVLEEWTALEAHMIEAAAEELVALGWIAREWRVWWIIDGLEHEPQLSLNNQNHRKFVSAQLDALPNLEIVHAFRARYGLDPHPTPPKPPIGTPSERDRKGIPMPSEGHPQGIPMPFGDVENPRNGTDPGCGDVENSCPADAMAMPCEGHADAMPMPCRSHPTPPVTPPHQKKNELDSISEVWKTVRDVAQVELGLSQLSYAEEQRNRSVLRAWEFKEKRDPEMMLAALRGFCMMRNDPKVEWPEAGVAYGLRALYNTKTVYDQGLGESTVRPIYVVAQERYYAEEPERPTAARRSSSNRPQAIGDVLKSVLAG